MSTWQYFGGFFFFLLEKSFSRQSVFQWVRIVPLFSPTYFCIHSIRSEFHTVFPLNGKETVSISVQSHLQVHRWCIVHKQPRIRKLSGPDISCWTWDQGHHREHHFRFLPRFTSVDLEGWSISHFHLRQRRWFQFPHHKLSVPDVRSNIPSSPAYGVFISQLITIRPGLLLVWMFHSKGQVTFQ